MMLCTYQVARTYMYERHHESLLCYLPSVLGKFSSKCLLILIIYFKVFNLKFTLKTNGAVEYMSNASFYAEPLGLMENREDALFVMFFITLAYIC